MKNVDQEPMSLRAYAKRRGVVVESVSLAVKSGRLSKSVTRNARGQPKIADPELADREWDATTDLSRAPGYVRERAEKRRTRGAPEEPAAEDGDDQVDVEEDDPMSTAGLPSAQKGMSLVEASAIEKVWKAKLAELKYRKEAAELIPKAQVQRTYETTFQSCKTKLLAIPSRARQALPHLAAADISLVERLVREALEGLSDAAA